MAMPVALAQPARPLRASPAASASITAAAITVQKIPDTG